MRQALLVATADVHLCENAPSFRSSEPDWFEAQRRQLRWLDSLSKKLGCPIVVAGDLFDKAVGTTRLVNFAADEFPICYAVAGNHDLPYHDFQKMRQSSYGNLVRTGKINDIDGVLKYDCHGVSVALHGFPFGAQFRPCKKYADFDIAVVHEFVWTGLNNSALTRILASSHVSVRKRELPGYDFYIFGDNHQPFIEDNVINCGAFYRRMKFDVDYVPSVVVIYDDGSVDRIDVPIERDIISLSSNKVKVIKSDGVDFSTSSIH